MSSCPIASVRVMIREVWSVTNGAGSPRKIVIPGALQQSTRTTCVVLSPAGRAGCPAVHGRRGTTSM
jgi:hypothetical protein